MKKYLEITIEVEAKRNIIDMEHYDATDGEEVELSSKERVSEVFAECIARNIENHIEDLYDDEDCHLRDAISDELDCDFEDFELSDIAEISIKCKEVE